MARKIRIHLNSAMEAYFTYHKIKFPEVDDDYQLYENVADDIIALKQTPDYFWFGTTVVEIGIDDKPYESRVWIYQVSKNSNPGLVYC